MAIHALIILAFIYSAPLIRAESVSPEAENETLQSESKSLSKIHLPQVPVPEFPKFVSRPGKNPLPIFGSSSSGSGSQNQYQQHPQQQQQQQVPVPPQQHQPLNIPSPLLYMEQDDDMKGEQVEFIMTEMVPDYHEGFAPSSEEYSRPASPAALPDKAQNGLASKPSAMHLPARPASTMTENANAPIPAATSVTVTGDASADKNDEGKGDNPVTGDKVQESAELSMPAHVMNILTLLGMANGGSLAQASKPEKEGTGHGFTTANAIGYATGDNATVTASVSNKMEVNTQTVILTESATASASSLSNGTAFSQATLNSNGWPSQFENGWKGIPGSGWAKRTHPVKKGKKLRRRRHVPLPLLI